MTSWTLIRPMEALLRLIVFVARACSALTLNALRQNRHNKVTLTNDRAARRDAERGFLPCPGMVLLSIKDCSLTQDNSFDYSEKVTF